MSQLPRGPKTLEEALQQAYAVDAVYFSVFAYELMILRPSLFDPREILIMPKRMEEELRRLWGAPWIGGGEDAHSSPAEE